VMDTGRTSEGNPPVGFSASAKVYVLMDSCWLDGGCVTRIQCRWDNRFSAVTPPQSGA
jgi:hypothetical protein